MKKIIQKANAFAWLNALAFLLVLAGCQKSVETSPSQEAVESAKDPKSLKDFTQVNLVGSNNEYNPARIDPLLVNVRMWEG